MLPALAALQAEAEKTRERDAAFAGLFMSSSHAERGPLAPTSCRWRGRRRATWTASPSTRSATGRRIREGQERAQRTIDARIDQALLRVGDGPRGGAARRPADRPASTSSWASPRAWRRPTPTGRSTTTSRSSSRARSWPTRTSAWASSTRPRPRSPPRRTRWWTWPLALDPLYQQNRELGEEAAGRLRRGSARATCRRCSRSRAAWSRRTRTARCASPSAPVKGKTAPDGILWYSLHRRSRASSRRRPARASSTRRRGSSRPSAPCGPASRRRSSSRRSATCRSTSSRRWTRPAATPARRRSTRKGEFVGLLFDGTYDIDRVRLPVRHGEHALDPRGRAATCCG